MSPQRHFSEIWTLKGATPSLCFTLTLTVLFFMLVEGGRLLLLSPPKSLVGTASQQARALVQLDSPLAV